MAADDIVNVQITLKSKAPTAAGFGRPLFLAYHTHWLARTKLYSASTGLADMLTDGFLATDKVYQDVQATLSQNPSTKDFKIGRRALPFTEVTNLIPTVTVQGFIYSGAIDGVAFTYTVLAGATIATISTALAALFSGLAVGITASGASTTWAACTSNVAGKVHEYSALVPELHVLNVTPNPGIETDLALVKAADNDWFGLCIDSNGKAEILAVAAAVETMRKLFFYVTADFAAKDSTSTTDVMYLAKASNYFNTLGFYHHDSGGQMAAAALGRFLPLSVGSVLLAHKAVVGPAPSDTAPNGSRWLSDSEAAAVLAKNGNTYTTLGSQGDIQEGTVAGGDFVDNVRNIHCMHARIQELYIGKLQGDGYAMTEAGISKANNDLLNLLQSWTKAPLNMLDPDPTFAPTVTTPLITDLSDADKAIRHLPDVEFTARMQGGIQLIDVIGSVTV